MNEKQAHTHIAANKDFIFIFDRIISAHRSTVHMIEWENIQPFHRADESVVCFNKHFLLGTYH